VRRRRLRSLAFGLLVVALSSACTGPEPPSDARALPLAELAARARPFVETDQIDLGTAKARRRIGAGWGPDETSPAEGAFLWSVGRASWLEFDVVEPRPRRLLLRGWSFPFGDDPPQEVEVSVNGEVIGRRVLDLQPGSVQIEIPERRLHLGVNRLELRPRRTAKGEPIEYAAGWSRLRLTDRRRQEVTPPAFAEDDVLELPGRTGIEWVEELPPGTFLAWDGVESARGTRLVVEVESEGGRASAREVEPGAPGRLLLADPDGGHALTRWLAVAPGHGGRVRWKGVRLILPRQASSTASVATEAPPGGARPPNLIVYLIDTLRPDHLGCYGYGRPTSPRIDRFAAGAARWIEGRSQSSWTRPAVATLLTGLEPPTHGAQQSYDRLPDEVETIAERLSAAGWEAAMVTTNGNVAARFGFLQGWTMFDYLPERRRRPEHHVQSEEVHRWIVDWLDRRDADRPFLLFVHTTDPHDPYTPSEPFRSRLAPGVIDPSAGSRRRIEAASAAPPEEAAAMRADLMALYDAEIARNDASFGALLDELDRRGLAGSTAVWLTSDHGEEFLEHGGWTHGRTLYEEQLRIPMILRLPDGRGAGRTPLGPAEQIDIVPTLIELAGLPADPRLPGRSLLGDLADRPLARSADLDSFAWLSRNELAIRSVVRSQWKLVMHEVYDPAVGAPRQLFALASDPGERRSVLTERPLRAGWLAASLREAALRFAPIADRVSAELDAEAEANLRALGYL